ncbi:hypothetical protein ACQ902_000007 [Vibrio mimicus]
MSTIVFRNSQEAFIHKNVLKILLSEGHEESNANRGADFSVEIYRCTASFGLEGKRFEYCLGRARVLVLPAKKSAEKNQAHTE